jgi:hypothetical protein
MRALTCPKCGAPVELDDDGGLASCPFCGSTLAPTRAVPRASGAERAGEEPELQVGAPVVIDLRGHRAAARGVAWMVMLFLAAIFGFTGWMVWKSVASATAGMKSAFDAAGVGLPGTSRPRKPAELAAITGHLGWLELDAAPPPASTGGFGALDPVAALPWAVAIAQAWAPDAAIERVDVTRLRPDGTVNVADDAEAEVTYRFVSPARIADYRRRAELSTRAEAEAELFVQLAGGKLTALILRGTPDDEPAPPYPKVLPTTELARRLARDERFQRPFLQGYLIRLEREGWVWYLSPLSRGESLPRVRATDARPWPYR